MIWLIAGIVLVLALGDEGKKGPPDSFRAKGGS